MFFKQKSCTICESGGCCADGCNSTQIMDDMTINSMIDVLTIMQRAGYGNAFVVNSENGRPFECCQLLNLDNTSEKMVCLPRWIWLLNHFTNKHICFIN